MRLPINALGMGFSAKDAHDHLVGRHGEDFKLAAWSWGFHTKSPIYPPILLLLIPTTTNLSRYA
jgi:hypothetical protein